MAKSAGNRGEAGTILWAVAAVAGIALFLVWISRTAEPSVPPDLGATDTTQAAAGPSGTPVAAAAFEAGVATFRNTDIILQDVPVVQQMGRAIVWVELPSGSPFLVKLTDALVAAGGMPPAQARVNVQGRVLEKTDSILNAWQQAGILADAGHRAQAEFGTSYIEATAIRPAR